MLIQHENAEVRCYADYKTNDYGTVCAGVPHVTFRVLSYRVIMSPSPL